MGSWNLIQILVSDHSLVTYS